MTWIRNPIYPWDPPRPTPLPWYVPPTPTPYPRPPEPPRPYSPPGITEEQVRWIIREELERDRRERRKRKG